MVYTGYVGYAHGTCVMTLVFDVVVVVIVTKLVLTRDIDLQLEEKLKEKIDVGLAEKIDLVNEQDVFHS